MPGAGSSHRALTLTPTGQRELLPQLGLDAAW